MKSLARVIPTVVAHELKDMGELVDIDSDQVQEEIVSVVDEVHIYERVCNISFCKPIMRVLLVCTTYLELAILPCSLFSLGTFLCSIWNVFFVLFRFFCSWGLFGASTAYLPRSW